jgi:UPF0755 protein
MTKKSSFFKKLVISFVFIFLISALVGGYYAYKVIYQPNVNLGKQKSRIIYIPTGSSFDDVISVLGKNNILKDRATFEFLSEKKNYKNNIKPGKYRILARMSNNALINLLRGGIQEPIIINFNGIRTKEQLVARVARRIEADSADLYDAMNDDDYLGKYRFNSDNVLALFIPNTYEIFWNTSTDEFFERMAKEYRKVWTEERKQQAAQLGFSQVEVAILASIVQAEQCCDYEEKRKIAGLYINRLKKKMALQSDPTVIYAIGDFSIDRVSYKQTRLNLRHNTYRNKGLPPGPINFVQVSSIDAVLNYDKNDYIFMCAKEDLSGKHYFSKTYEQHCGYAKKYRHAMDKLGIR